MSVDVVISGGTAPTVSVNGSSGASVSVPSSSGVAVSVTGGMGPQGPQGASGVSAISQASDVAFSAPTDGDVIRYSTGKWRNYPETNLVDGGNF